MPAPTFTFLRRVSTGAPFTSLPCLLERPIPGSAINTAKRGRRTEPTLHKNYCYYCCCCSTRLRIDCLHTERAMDTSSPSSFISARGATGFNVVALVVSYTINITGEVHINQEQISCLTERTSIRVSLRCNGGPTTLIFFLFLASDLTFSGRDIAQAACY